MDFQKKTSIFNSGIITIAIRWSNRVIGFASTLILARLLDPDDFGIIAIAFLVIGFINVFSDFGIHVALIRKVNPSPAHYNTAWTLRLIQMGVTAFIVFGLAPFAANYFGDSRLTPVLRVLSLGLLFVGLKNIGVITFQKEMQFDLEFRFKFLEGIVGFFVIVILAIQIGSYWALVIGTLFQKGFGAALSYVVHPMRPSFSLEKFKEIFSISQWLLVKNFGSYLHKNLHKVFVGANFNDSIMGGYSLAEKVSSLPGRDLLGPINRALFPAFARVKHDLNELKRLFLLAQGVQAFLVMPISVGLALVASEAVQILLGEKWLFAVPFLQVLAYIGFVQAITTSFSYVMLTVGRISSLTLWVWGQAIVFLLIVFPILPRIDALQIAELRLLTVLGGLFWGGLMLKKTMNNIKYYEIINSLLRPALATLIMSIAILTAAKLMELPVWAMLIGKVIIGTAAYFISITLMWRVIGKPQGAESYLFGKLIDLFNGTSLFKKRLNLIFK